MWRKDWCRFGYNIKRSPDERGISSLEGGGGDVMESAYFFSVGQTVDESVRLGESCWKNQSAASRIWFG